MPADLDIGVGSTIRRIDHARREPEDPLLDLPERVEIGRRTALVHRRHS